MYYVAQDTGHSHAIHWPNLVRHKHTDHFYDFDLLFDFKKRKDNGVALRKNPDCPTIFINILQQLLWCKV